MIKIKNANTQQNGVLDKHMTHNTYTNPVRKAKHFPASTKEWINSIYSYNSVKDFSYLDKTLAKLIRIHFNLYSNKLRKNIRKHGSRRFEIRKSRRLMKKVFIGKPELKHSNDSVNVTVYIYNNEGRALNNRVNKNSALYKTNSLVRLPLLNEKNKLIVDKFNSNKILYLDKTNKLATNIKSKLINKKNLFLKKNYKLNKLFVNINRYNKHFVKSYVRKLLRKEIFAMYCKQMVTFNKHKFEKKYVILLANSVAKLYNKKIQFNFVSLKHIYLDSQLSSMGLITKLRRLARAKVSFIKGLTRFMIMFKVPRISSLLTYNEIFNKQLIDQNVNNNNLLFNHKLANMSERRKRQDIIDNSLNITNYIAQIDFDKYKAFNSIVHNVFTISKGFNSIKHKTINGVRLEIAGRFTKSSSAARSVFKIRNKGSIRNKDSSHKGLKSVLLKGYAKSNLQYNKVYSKVRGGSFGIKNSLSGS